MEYKDARLLFVVFAHNQHNQGSPSGKRMHACSLSSRRVIILPEKSSRFVLET